MKIMNLSLIVAASVGVATAADTAKNDWPRFRGPTGDGVSLAKGIPTTWSATNNVLWAAKMPRTVPNEKLTKEDLKSSSYAYNPWSSPIISGDKVFVTTAGARREEHKLLCFNQADGKPLWETSIPPGPVTPRQMTNLLENTELATGRGVVRKNTHIAIGYDTCTPCSDGERVFVMFQSYALTAVDFQGKVLWQKPLAKADDKTPADGHYAKETDVTLPICCGSSPVVYKDLVIQVLPKSIMAFDRKTGDLKYEIKDPQFLLEVNKTPIFLPFKDKTHMIYVGENIPMGIDPENGKILWTTRIKNRQNGTSPVYYDGFLCNGYYAIAVDAASTGDISKNEQRLFLMDVKAGGSSPVVQDGTLYKMGTDLVNNMPGKSININGIDIKTGNQTCKIPIPGFRGYTSPIATADGYVYCVSGGRSYVIKTGPKPEIVGVNELGDDNGFPSPAVADGKLIIRGNSKLWCIGKP
jgi:outer membrane protein assembly factor BamB